MFCEVYKLYFDKNTKKIKSVTQSKQNPNKYDEMMDEYLDTIDLGANFISFLDIDNDSINKMFNEFMNIFETQQMDSIHDFFHSLWDIHDYFGCYLADFSQKAITDYCDSDEWIELLIEYQEDYKEAVEFSKYIITNFIDSNSDLTYPQILLMETQKKDNIFHYSSTTESILEDFSQSVYTYNEYCKLSFKDYMNEYNNELISKYNVEKELYLQNNSEINYKYSETFCYSSRYHDRNHLDDTETLTYDRFLQYEFETYKENNDLTISNSYHDYISNLQLTITECVSSSSIKELLMFEFSNLVKYNLKIKKCLNCNKYFIPSGDYDTKYCDRIYKDGLSCKVIGGRKTTYRKIENTPELKLYDRFYKRYKARIRNGNMTIDQFNKWNRTAKTMRNQCINNQISLEMFTDWLNNYSD